MAAAKTGVPLALPEDIEPMLTRLKLSAIGDQLDTLLDEAARAELNWFNASHEDSLVKAALSHVWFETIHPMDDGNGRVGRNIVDLCLARDAGETSRLVRISQRLLGQREACYSELGRAQHGGLDVTPWMVWFVRQVRIAWEAAGAVVVTSLEKARFWAAHAGVPLNARQREAVNAPLNWGPGGFEGGMSTRKYVSLTSTSRPTRRENSWRSMRWECCSRREPGDRRGTASTCQGGPRSSSDRAARVSCGVTPSSVQHDAANFPELPRTQELLSKKRLRARRAFPSILGL